MNDTQRDINEAEWSNPDNWGGVGVWRVYFSKRDSRILVPTSRSKIFGGTIINLGHSWGGMLRNLFLTYWIVVIGFLIWIARK